jgi:hypothetical protein
MTDDAYIPYLLSWLVPVLTLKPFWSREQMARRKYKMSMRKWPSSVSVVFSIVRWGRSRDVAYVLLARNHEAWKTSLGASFEICTTRQPTIFSSGSKPLFYLIRRHTVGGRIAWQLSLSDDPWCCDMGCLFASRLIQTASDYEGSHIIRCSGASTAKQCGACGELNDKLGGSKTFNCQKCGAVADRDVHAVRNILLRCLQRAWRLGCGAWARACASAKTFHRFQCIKLGPCSCREPRDEDECWAKSVYCSVVD